MVNRSNKTRRRNRGKGRGGAAMQLLKHTTSAIVNAGSGSYKPNAKNFGIYNNRPARIRKAVIKLTLLDKAGATTRNVADIFDVSVMNFANNEIVNTRSNVLVTTGRVTTIRLGVPRSTDYGQVADLSPVIEVFEKGLVSANDYSILIATDVWVDYKDAYNETKYLYQWILKDDVTTLYTITTDNWQDDSLEASSEQ